MSKDKYFIIDFDSTFTKVEALDELGEISLNGAPDKEQILQEVKRLTDSAMAGQSSFSEGLAKRLALLKAHQNHLPQLISRLKENVSQSVRRNKEFLTQFSDQIFIVSSGFKEFITPIVTEYGIKEANIYANTFRYDEQGNITGFDTENVLSLDKGKIKLLESLALAGDVYVLGDGYTDYEIKEAGLANKFYAFTENVVRDNVVAKAEHIAPSLDEFLYQNKLPMAISYPKNRISVLLLENIHPKAVEMFRREGYQVETISGALSEEELCEKIKNVSILGIRSKTHVTRKVLEHANRLMNVGAFCIGTNQIDLDACLEAGIPVFNAPYSNTRSVVEMAIGEIIMLSRGIPDKSSKMHQSEWDKSAAGSFEVRDKKLGIVGYGNIGAQLSVLAEAMGMEVYYYDIVEKLQLGNARKCETLHELLSKVDIVTLHVDGRPENKNMFGAKEFAAMKDGALFLNLSRGHVVEIEALVESIKSGKIRGAGVDVFPEEPATNSEPFESELRNLPNVILTPHIGGSTLEAQENIANFVPSRIMDYINSGNTYQSVNFPNIQLPELKNAHRLIHIHANVPGVLASINQVLANNHVNILGQYLKTNERVGYVITDIDKEYDKQVVNDMKQVPHTIKFRILY
ncbi:D-3-phosphoglycerate dehydrogenase [Pontibacter ummariensis]|uniref:D-3-phosphoglycerate dehydrogenase n=1 Tax=Pontibacter ummariensis TaxID=1610492 RepID=A0A239G9J8_9BACT|nr:phosphoglycerate dehydrogenase [Pontibacter ummariensis]PRY11575.1 D-3-phosphoglycerate dehydrogenase [Pontibacter ummariensis]SNS65819.1 D-3-phosphoglycerate dehydrogenase [Pontibacter ummariensis]